jgi:cytidine deaminase
MSEFERLIKTALELTGHRELSDTTTAGKVASALITTAGNIYSGVCIDTSCSMGFCAEHNAIGTMITAGETEISAIVAVKQDGKILSPCGRCREFIMQVAPYNRQTQVILAVDKSVPLTDLLPYYWRDESLFT